MRKIDLINTETRSVKWIFQEYEQGLLMVDNSFQREYVWLKKHQIRLIETILLGYSIPEIYLWNIDTDPDSGNSVYSIVDGQQRIGAVRDFINGKFVLSEQYLTHKGDNNAYKNKGWTELSADEKKAVWEYPFSVRFIKRDMEKDDIVTMFLRLNSNNMTLNPQELRNAEFDGLFLKLAEEISEHEFWEKYKIFTTRQVRRMADIQFISQLLIFLRKGVEGETSQEAINTMYSKYNENYPELEEDKREFMGMLKTISIIFDADQSNLKLIKRITHLYNFFVLAYFINRTHSSIPSELIDKISKFVKVYNNSNVHGDLLDRKIVDSISKYKKLAAEGTQSKSKRLSRIRLLKTIFEM